MVGARVKVIKFVEIPYGSFRKQLFVHIFPTTASLPKLKGTVIFAMYCPPSITIQRTQYLMSDRKCRFHFFTSQN